MFGQKAKNTIDSLIGLETTIEGNIQFRGGLRVDGHVKGSLIANPIEGSMLVISEQARVEGEVRAEHIVVDGEITGPVFCGELLELQPMARITGDVHYKALEMHGGALVSGKLSHQQENEQVLKLAVTKTAANV
jgi:cytoskeletal protein CcmA (bactofilin family)